MFVVIGTTTVDLLVPGMPERPGLGDGIRADNLVFSDKPTLMLMGGNGGNSAYVLGRLGVDTAICSSIGQDPMGDWLAARLADQNIYLDGLLRQAELATSCSTILLDKSNNQTVIHHKGATDAMALSKDHESLFRRAEVLLASSYPLFTRMRPAGFARALSMTREAGGVTAVDIGPAIGDPVTIAELAPLLPYLDYLLANVHELEQLDQVGDWEAVVSNLLTRGCRCVVIKKGAEGAALRSRDLALDVPAFPVVANITVGAGDSFNAGFLYALWASRSLSATGSITPAELDDKPSGLFRAAQQRSMSVRNQMREAIRFGNAVAALVVSGQRGVFSAPSLDTVRQFNGQ